MKQNLWARTSELFFSRPILLLPVLIADLFGFGLQQGQVAITHAILASHTQYHSALGGTVSGGAISQRAIEQINFVSLPIAATGYYLRVVLYVIALAIVAHMVRKGLTRFRNAEPARPRVSSILLVALRVLIVFLVCIVLWSWMVGWMLRHKHDAVAHSPYLAVVFSLVLVAVLAFGVTPSALRMIAGTQLSAEQIQAGRMMAVAMAVFFVALQFFVSLSARQMLSTTPARQALLAALASLLTAVPYIPMFIGFALVASEETAVPSAEA